MAVYFAWNLKKGVFPPGVWTRWHFIRYDIPLCQRGDIVHSMYMRPRNVPGRLLIVCVLPMCLWGCSRKKMEEPSAKAAPSSVQALIPAAYTDTTAEFPHLKFTNGTSSINDRCPVRKAKLNTKLSPLFVNGQPIGFC